MVSKYRPNIPILAFTANLRAARELNVVWGVQSIYSPLVTGDSIEEKARNAIKMVHIPYSSYDVVLCCSRGLHRCCAYTTHRA
jgi:pyruvate kinase